MAWSHAQNGGTLSRALTKRMDPLNDTDPQSPMALGPASRPLPGSTLETPTPRAAAVDELLQSVTGPRPPPRRLSSTPPTPSVRPSSDSLRPIERRPDELTVFTGKRAWARNGMTTMVSAMVVAAVLVVVVRWADMHRSDDVVNALRPLTTHAGKYKLVRLKTLLER